MQHTNLTQSQMMIWLGQQKSPSSPLYNMILTFEINGKVNLSYFERAFQKLVANNDVLRCHIALKDNVPVQTFFDVVDNPLIVLDVSNAPNPYDNYLQWVEANKNIVYDGGQLLYQAVIFKIHSNKYIFYFNQHHLITDGWSIKYLYDELNNNYQKLLKSEELADVVANGFQSYAKENTFEHLTEITPYWENKLHGKTELPILYGSKAVTIDSRSTRINFSLGKERTQKVKELTQHPEIRAWTAELALSNIFLTTIAALVYKVSDQEEFTVGVPYHNRLTASQRKTAGLFMELLPMQVSVEQEDTLITLLGKLKQESLEVIKNTMMGKSPSELLKTFNVLMNFIPNTFNDFAGIPSKTNWLLADHSDPNHHIRLQIQDFDAEGDYKLQFDFNDNLFSKDQMNRIGEHFITILDVFLEDKHSKLSEINIITADEINRIKNWNSTTLAYNETETLLSKFEVQAAKNPDTVALKFENKVLTYSELNKKSNQVAHFIHQKKIKRNEVIAISFERSLEMMVYIYGILKAGAAYLPVDTAIPNERLNFILKNAAVDKLFSNHYTLDQSAVEIQNLYSVESIAAEVSLLPTDTPEVRIEPTDIAYVIYTSGSTGEPKGVKCHHSGICNRLNWMNSDYPITKEDVLLQKTPVTFDVSVWELFWPLQVGSKLVIETPEGHKNPEQLIETICTNTVTHIHFVPSMLNVFLETEGVDQCKSLKRIFCSGEALSVSSVTKVHTHLDVEVHNLYGPTEASVDVTSWYCKRGELKNVIPIGYPVANTRIYILDTALTPVPLGVVGELYIAGKQVAAGYVNNEKLTDQVFLKDIFSADDHAKMYKSGDLARYGTDGAIEYLGRVDTQIKLRGLRIELGEIENTMMKFSSIAQAVVKVVMLGDDQETLVAYYTGNKLAETEITGFLANSLPDYMIPSNFVHLQAFEFLSSGKINRKKLPVYEVIKAQEIKPYAPPTNEFEEIIAEAWCEVLKLEKVGINENFIGIGGNSLKAMVITSRLKAEFELNLPMNLVFNYTTIKSYAAYVEKMIIELLSD